MGGRCADLTLSGFNSCTQCVNLGAAEITSASGFDRPFRAVCIGTAAVDVLLQPILLQQARAVRR